MNTSNNFFVELLKRLFSKNPKFFKWLQLAALVLGAISTLIGYLESQGTTLPASVNWIGDWVVKVSAFIAIIIAQLPNPNPEPEQKA